MNTHFLTQLPSDNAKLRRSLYSGRVFLFEKNEASQQLVTKIEDLLRQEIGRDYRMVHRDLDDQQFFRVVGALRRKIYMEQEYHSLIAAVVQSLGFSLKDQAFDPARLRTNAHNGHLNPAAAPIYFGHRDTWYANPQSTLTWWVPIHDVLPEDSFEFFPDDFGRSVKNDSETFDFDAWQSGGQANRIGWQKENTGKTSTYPSLMEAPQGHCWPVKANRGQILLFSAQQLHQTRNNVSNRTRFSLDFRTVDLVDHKLGIHASNVDNRSTGSALDRFLRFTGGNEV